MYNLGTLLVCILIVLLLYTAVQLNELKKSNERIKNLQNTPAVIIQEQYAKKNNKKGIFSALIVQVSDQDNSQEIKQNTTQETKQNTTQETKQNTTQETKQNTTQETKQNTTQEIMQNKLIKKRYENEELKNDNNIEKKTKQNMGNNLDTACEEYNIKYAKKEDDFINSMLIDTPADKPNNDKSADKPNNDKSADKPNNDVVNKLMNDNTSTDELHIDTSNNYSIDNNSPIIAMINGVKKMNGLPFALNEINEEMIFIKDMQNIFGKDIFEDELQDIQDVDISNIMDITDIIFKEDIFDEDIQDIYEEDIYDINASNINTSNINTSNNIVDEYKSNNTIKIIEVDINGKEKIKEKNVNLVKDNIISTGIFGNMVEINGEVCFVPHHKMNNYEDITKITDNEKFNIYISDFDSAVSTSVIDKYKIYATVNACHEPYTPITEKYIFINIYDHTGTDITVHFDKINQYIDTHLQYGNVLVHCHAGISRSVSFVVAYLMWKNNWNSKQSLNYVSSRRTIACPNYGFMGQLDNYGNILKNNTLI